MEGFFRPGKDGRTPVVDRREVLKQKYKGLFEAPSRPQSAPRARPDDVREPAPIETKLEPQQPKSVTFSGDSLQHLLVSRKSSITLGFPRAPGSQAPALPPQPEVPSAGGSDLPTPTTRSRPASAMSGDAQALVQSLSRSSSPSTPLHAAVGLHAPGAPPPVGLLAAAVSGARGGRGDDAEVHAKALEILAQLRATTTTGPSASPTTGGSGSPIGRTSKSGRVPTVAALSGGHVRVRTRPGHNMLLHSSPLVAKQLATPAPPSEPSPSPAARRSVPCTTERRPSESARVSQVDGTETQTDTPPIPPNDAPAPLREPLPPQPPPFAPGDALREADISENWMRTEKAPVEVRPERQAKASRRARRKKKQRARAHADSHARARSSVYRWIYRPSVHAFCQMRESPASPDLASDALTSLLYPNYTPAHVKGKPPVDMLNESLRGPSANIREAMEQIEKAREAQNVLAELRGEHGGAPRAVPPAAAEGQQGGAEGAVAAQADSPPAPAAEAGAVEGDAHGHHGHHHHHHHHHHHTHHAHHAQPPTRPEEGAPSAPEAAAQPPASDELASSSFEQPRLVRRSSSLPSLTSLNVAFAEDRPQESAEAPASTTAAPSALKANVLQAVRSVGPGGDRARRLSWQGMDTPKTSRPSTPRASIQSPSAEAKAVAAALAGHAPITLTRRWIQNLGRPQIRLLSLKKSKSWEDLHKYKPLVTPKFYPLRPEDRAAVHLEKRGARYYSTLSLAMFPAVLPEKPPRAMATPFARQMFIREVSMRLWNGWRHERDVETIRNLVGDISGDSNTQPSGRGEASPPHRRGTLDKRQRRTTESRARRVTLRPPPSSMSDSGREAPAPSSSQGHYSGRASIIGGVVHALTASPVLTEADIRAMEEASLREKIEAMSALLDTDRRASAFNHCRRGALRLRLGDVTAAVADLDKAVELEPMLVDAYWHKHLLHHARGDVDAALDDLTHAISQNPRSVRVHLARAELLSKRGFVREAIVSLSAALRVVPRDPKIHFARGLLFDQEGEVQCAAEDYATVMVLDPSNVEAAILHGLKAFNAQRWEEAISNFGHALRQNPKAWRALTYRGMALAHKGRFELALEDLTHAIHLEPSSPVAFCFRGCVLRKRDPKKAIRDFSSSLLIDDSPENKTAYFHRGILYASIRRFDEALADFQAVIKLDKGNVGAHINKGVLLLTQYDQPRLAVAAFTAALKTDPTSIRALLCRADAYVRLNDIKMAIRDYTRLIWANPTHHSYRLHRGRLLLELKQLELSLYDVRCASVINAALGQTASQRGVVNLFLRNYDAAIRDFEELAESDPSPSLFVLLARTRMKNGQHADAIGDLRAAIEMDPRLYDAYFSLGQCLETIGEFEDAIVEYQRALALRPTAPEALHRRGLCRLHLNNGKGVSDLNRTIKTDPSNFDAYLTRACYYERRGQPGRGIIDCNEALKMQPASVRVFIIRGSLRARMGQFKHAVDDFGRALAIDANCTLAYFNRAVCEQDCGQYNEALRDYSTVLLTDDGNSNVLRNRGILYCLIGDYANAARDLLEVMSRDPFDASLHAVIGLCHHRLGKHLRAIQDYTEAVRINPFLLEAYVGRGNVRMDIGTPEELVRCRRDYARAIHLDPSYLPAYVNLGYVLQSQGRHKLAWLQFSSSAAINPRYRDGLEGRAVVNAIMGNTFGALLDMNRAVDVHPGAELLSNRGVIHERVGDNVNAMRDYAQAIAADPSFSLGQFNAGNMYLRTRQWDQAVTCLGAAVEADPRDECALVNRSIAHFATGELDAAVADLNSAEALCPDVAAVYFNRAAVHAAAGRYEQAEADYNRALQLQPTDSVAYERRGYVRGKLSRRQAAMEDFARSVDLQYAPVVVATPALNMFRATGFGASATPLMQPLKPEAV